jgi:hypothetical protein
VYICTGVVGVYIGYRSISEIPGYRSCTGVPGSMSCTVVQEEFWDTGLHE